MIERAEIIHFGTPCGEYIEQYLSEQSKQSKDTARNYGTDFRRFLKETFNTTIEDVTAEILDSVDYDVVIKYRNSLYGRLANSTINRHMQSLRSIMRHLKVRNIDGKPILKSDISYFESIKSLPNDSKEIEYMPIEIVDEYIAEAGKERNHPELKQALIMIAVDVALRIEEALDLRVGQFTMGDGYVTVRGYGKGNKEYMDKISVQTYAYLMDITKGDIFNPETKIFSPLNRKNVSDMMNRIKTNLRYQNRNFSFHSLKKTGVTMAYRVTGDILEAQRKGRHSSLETTRKYLKSEDYGITGVFSLRDFEEDLYKKTDHDTLIEAIGEMGKDFQHLLNMKLSSKTKEEKKENVK